jgi:hypothetical protein
MKHEPLYRNIVMARFNRAIALSIVLMPMGRSGRPMTMWCGALQRF